MNYPAPTPKQISHAKDSLRRFNIEHPARPIDQQAIVQALSADTPYFITTYLYWDCECPTNYTRPVAMNMCENCGAFQNECPDSAISDIRSHSIHIDLTDPQVVATLEEHNISARRQEASPIASD